MFNTPFLKFKTFLSNLLKKDKINEQNSSNSNNKNFFLSAKILTDKVDLDRIEPYFESLKLALDENGVKNIAITGNYGSGKSTILKTFQEKYKGNYNFLNISLANFDKTRLKKVSLKPNQNESDFISSSDQEIEISILQQLFYQVDPKKIPNSRFKRILNIKWYKKLFIALIILVFIYSCFALFQNESLTKLNPNNWSFHKPFEFMILSLIVLFSSTFLYLFSKIYNVVINSRINKFNIKGEVEISNSSNSSFFNQYIDELIYFFECTEYNVVMIEDLDRFDDSNIFIKLREINVLINATIPFDTES